jgi:hypothetical protein
VFGQFELDRVTSFLLSNGRTIDGVSSRSNIIDLEPDYIAAAQLAIARSNGQGRACGLRFEAWSLLTKRV